MGGQMHLSAVYVRFFRSFNFDFLRQHKDSVDENPWDALGPDRAYYPFVTVDLERDITTVVGANESGKSQLITAIQCLLGTRAVEPKDFCRYSTFFGVRGGMRVPEFGGKFSGLDERDRAALRSVTGDTTTPDDEFWFFRLSDGEFIYLRESNGKYRPFRVSDDVVTTLNMPFPRLIDAETALPQNISLHALANGTSVTHGRDRRAWSNVYRSLHDNEGLIDTLAANPTAITAIVPPHVVTEDARERERREKALALARDMLVKVAEIDQRAFVELLAASGEDDGYGEALAARITDALAVSLNFPNWWSQDQDFALEVRKDGFYLVLTMRDRTGQTYTFDERSSGMKYFLSYFVQYKAYAPNIEGRPELLLMDEPDAFLSTQGQQDLLHIFDAYAHPEDGTPPAQVVYVTHSPFLIDKNRPDRIRVLQKGSGEEGTRVVKKASVDKYEPLRSAFGSFHAETAFIGNCNLLVEGPADQVLFAGISSAMRADGFHGSPLDLNELTIVPVHGATQYRYTLHLTRGRDLDRPAVVVLLDSDSEGLRARPGLELGYKDQQIINPELIFAIGDLDATRLSLAVDEVHEPEDLVPTAVARAAVIHFAREVFSGDDAVRVAEKLPSELEVANGSRLFDSAQKAATAASAGCARRLSLGKIEFARAVCAVIPDLNEGDRKSLLGNFSELFGQINARQQRAVQEHTDDRLHDTTKRLVDRFKMDHRARATKSSVSALLDQIEQQLVGSSEHTEIVRASARVIRERFELSRSPLDNIADLAGLKSELGKLVYRAMQNEVDRA